MVSLGHMCGDWKSYPRIVSAHTPPSLEHSLPGWKLTQRTEAVSLPQNTRALGLCRVAACPLNPTPWPLCDPDDGVCVSVLCNKAQCVCLGLPLWTEVRCLKAIFPFSPMEQTGRHPPSGIFVIFCPQELKSCPSRGIPSLPHHIPAW